MKGSSINRKEYVLNEYVIIELKKPHDSNAPLRVVPVASPGLVFIFVLFVFRPFDR